MVCDIMKAVECKGLVFWLRLVCQIWILSTLIWINGYSWNIFKIGASMSHLSGILEHFLDYLMPVVQIPKVCFVEFVNVISNIDLL